MHGGKQYENKNNPFKTNTPHSDVSDNSPLLEKCPGLLIDYSDLNGNGRIEVVSKSENDNDTVKDDDKPSEIPQTDDNSNPMLWFIILLVSGTCFFGIILYNRKRRTTVK